MRFKELKQQIANTSFSSGHLAQEIASNFTTLQDFNSHLRSITQSSLSELGRLKDEIRIDYPKQTNQMIQTI